MFGKQSFPVTGRQERKKKKERKPEKSPQKTSRRSGSRFSPPSALAHRALMGGKKQVKKVDLKREESREAVFVAAGSPRIIGNK